MLVADDPCLQVWLRGLAANTAKNRLPLMAKFFTFVGLSPEETVAWQKQHPGDYRFVDLSYTWVDANQHLSVNSKLQRVRTVRGFFLANRVPLPKDKHRFHSEKRPVVCDLSVEDLRKILASCDVKHRAAYLVQFQSGSGIGELSYINTHLADHVWDEVRKGNRLIRLDMPGRKQNRGLRSYYTFIGSDAVDALKDYFHSQGWRKDSVLFRNQYGNPVTRQNLHTYFRYHAWKVGVIDRVTLPCPNCQGETVRVRRKHKGLREIRYVCTACHAEFTPEEVGMSSHVKGGIRYMLKTHELRDVFRTEFHRAQTYVGVDVEAAEFFMGHSVDPLQYDKIMKDKQYGLEQYRRAMPFLNILSEEPRKIERSEVQSELEALRERIVDQEKDLNKFRKVLDDPELLAVLRELKQKRK